MAKKSTPAPTTPKPEGKQKGHKARFFISLFSSQAKAKLTDEQLAAKANAEYPDSRDWLKSMPGLRSHYNQGKFTGQASRPATTCAKYTDGGVAITRGAPTKAVKTAKPPKAPAVKAAASAAKASKPPIKMVIKKKAPAPVA